MQRAACFLRIAAGQVHGVWNGASWGGGQRFEAASGFGAEEDEPTLRDAVDAVLTAILPPRRLTSPFLCVTLEGPLVMAAILPFAKLPKAQEDRRLIISQRFCREHRLEPGKIEVLGSQLQGPKTANDRMLCLAVERNILREFQSALFERDLHADIIAPDCLMKFTRINGSELEKPGLSLFEENGFATILVWDGDGSLAHIATVRRPAPHDLEGQRRMAARVRRYAYIVARDDTPVAVYFERRPAGNLFKDLASHRAIKLAAWPSERQSSPKGSPSKGSAK